MPSAFLFGDPSYGDPFQAAYRPGPPLLRYLSVRAVTPTLFSKAT